jgi:UDP-N-acetylmuramoyl-tripeptide--D-alanyl-D-alanine ligase
MQNLQWYSYKVERILFKHKRYTWHLVFFALPLVVYYLVGKFFWIYFYFALIPLLIRWYAKIDKKLVFTSRVKRFFAFVFIAVIFQDMLCFSAQKCQVYGVLIPIIASTIASFAFEKIMFLGFYRQAKKKLASMNELKIIAITASYGKTSIKNFLHHILNQKFNTYKTPRSVNTLGGLMKDINEELPLETEIYIAEAGAREKGDIKDITNLLTQHYSIVGKIGTAHIDYFKTLENIRNTKMELIQTPNLVKAFVDQSANVKGNDKVQVVQENTDYKLISSTLDGIQFSMNIDGKEHQLQSQILGSFNVQNLASVILLSLELGVDIEYIKQKIQTIKPVEHRLQKIEQNGKLIIDDSFNGNIDGMVDSYEMVKNFDGNKILITCGVIESTKDINIKLAKKIDEVFDAVIITGQENVITLMENIKKAKKIPLADKSKLQDILAKETHHGDLILFSNDAPTFV